MTQFPPTVREDTRRGLSEHEEKLWTLVLAKVAELERDARRHSNRGVALLESSGQAVSTIAQIGQEDGSTRVYFITATGQWSREPQVRVEQWFHNSEPYWEEQLADRSNAVVVDGRHYRIGKEPSARELSSPRHVLGCAGRKYSIRFHDGREVVTHNLWVQGTIPQVFRDRLPDNATFVDSAVSE